MDIDSDTLAVALSDEFEGCKIRVDEDQLVLYERPVAAGMYFSDYYEAFVEEVERFLVMHTVEWNLTSSHCNTSEGYHAAVLERNEKDT